MHILFPRVGISKRKEITILILCVLVGFAFRFYQFDQKSLWIDEIHTLLDSSDGFFKQIEYYRENPAYLHPPLFFMLTHTLHPFSKPERDLRIIPVVFGALSVPFVYLLAGLFSPSIALPCSLSLTVMAYHISLSQDARSYTMILFLGILTLYLFMRYLSSYHKRYLIGIAALFTLLFLTSYTTLFFIIFVQLLWFYPIQGARPHFQWSSFFFLNLLSLFLSLPWILFLLVHFKSQPLLSPFEEVVSTPLWNVIYNMFHDWTSSMPLMIVSAVLVMVYPFFSENRRQSLVLIALFISPALSIFLFCKISNFTHFVTSRYLICFLPIFHILLFLSLETFEKAWVPVKKFFRPTLVFMILLIVSNLMFLPIYYRSEKQDFRGLTHYLKANLRPGDVLFDTTLNMGRMPGIFHYLGILPKGRSYPYSYRDLPGGGKEFKISFKYEDHVYSIYHSRFCCDEFLQQGKRVWMIVADRTFAGNLQKNYPCILKNYFDGSVSNLHRFTTDASIYLFLWEPTPSGEKGMDLRIE